MIDNKILKNLEDLDELVELDDGVRGVKVFFQYKPRLHNQPRADRKTFLTNEFKAVQTLLEPTGARVDLDTVSPSGQMVQAIVPVEQLEGVQKELKARQMELQLDRIHKIV